MSDSPRSVNLRSITLPRNWGVVGYKNRGFFSDEQNRGFFSDEPNKVVWTHDALTFRLCEHEIDLTGIHVFAISPP